MDVDDALERSQWDFFWVPDGVAIESRSELAYLASAEDNPATNIVTRTRVPEGELGAAVAEVLAAHAGRTSRWMVVPGNRSDALERTLGDAGYEARHFHDAYSLSVDATIDARDVEVRRVMDRAGLDDALDVATQAFGFGLPWTEAFKRADVQRCRGPRVRRYVAYLDGQPASAGGMTWFPELKLVFLWAGGTVPDARGRGAYGAVLKARVDEARRLGAERVGLYAKRDTSAPIVAARGFEQAGPMIYWERKA
jgi:hypothetical protein